MLLLLTGCVFLENLPDLGQLDDYTPAVSLKDLDIRRVDFEGADVDFVFEVRNPNPVQVTLASFGWNLELGGQPFLDGADPDGFVLSADGKSDLSLPVSVKWTEVLALKQSLGEADYVPFSLSGDFGFNTPLGEIKLPYAHEGEFPMVRAPEVKLDGLKLKEIALLENRASNRQAVDLDLERLAYSVTLDGHKLVTGDKSIGTLSGSDTRKVSIPLDLDLLEAGAGLISAIKDKDPIQVGLDGQLDIGTRWGVLPLELDREKKLSLQ
jgi:LEA14-like dessication related protein